MEAFIPIALLIVLALFAINYGLAIIKTVIKLIFSPAGAILGTVAAVIFIYGG